MKILTVFWRNSAFTLIEFLVVIAMIAVVLSIGVPNMPVLVAGNRVSSALNNLVHHLHYARSEAVRLATPVVLCPSNDGDRCLNSVEWHHGFMLFADRNHNRKRDFGEPLLRYQPSGVEGVRILSTIGRKKLTYQASGMAPGSTATLTVCDAQGRTMPRAVIISNPGRPRLSDTRADGAPLRC